MGFFLGIVFEKIILRKLKKIALKTKWEEDEIIVKSLHGMPILWFVLAGIYGAILHLPITPNLLSFFQKVLLVLIIFSATAVLAKIAVGFVNLYAVKAKGVLPSTTIFANLTKLFVFLKGDGRTCSSGSKL